MPGNLMMPLCISKFDWTVVEGRGRYKAKMGSRKRSCKRGKKQHEKSEGCA